MPERVGATLSTMPRDTLVDVALDRRQLVGGEATFVKATQVFPVRFAGIDVIRMLWKEAQEGAIPQQGAVFLVKRAHGNVQSVQRRGNRLQE